MVMSKHEQTVFACVACQEFGSLLAKWRLVEPVVKLLLLLYIKRFSLCKRLHKLTLTEHLQSSHKQTKRHRFTASNLDALLLAPHGSEHFFDRKLNVARRVAIADLRKCTKIKLIQTLCSILIQKLEPQSLQNM